MANILSGFELEAAVRIILAVIVGGIIGTERSHHGSAATTAAQPGFAPTSLSVSARR